MAHDNMISYKLVEMLPPMAFFVKRKKWKFAMLLHCQSKGNIKNCVARVTLTTKSSGFDKLQKPEYDSIASFLINRNFYQYYGDSRVSNNSKRFM